MERLDQCGAPQAQLHHYCYSAQLTGVYHLFCNFGFGSTDHLNLQGA
ncbi:hypothetical protein Poly30_37130 [Planctomycetes bacterium Poly30]|uniref:Uncharacterized protein n=1 Tax=Saltatorellus ferox TaxID=2528018 RepID=A0A518EVR5_9BACT|nr:hypothetical protein Poly30_37130 [Planctomycetes bacterium Poly30]